MWSFKAVRPKATYNWAANPSFEVEASGTLPPWTLGTGAMPGATTQTCFGARSLAFTGSQPSSGIVASQALNIISSPIAAAADLDRVVASVWLWLPAATPTVSLNLVVTSGGAVLGTVNADATKLNQWQRIYVVCPGVGITNTAVTVQLYVSGAVSGLLYFDGVQVEDGSQVSGYFDGMSQGCRWIGRPGLSPSVRPMSCRSSGVEVPLSNYLEYQTMNGWGKMAVTNVTLPFGLQGGELYQRTLRQARVASIIGAIGTNHSPAGYGLDYIHQAQAELCELLGSDLTNPQAPVRLIYSSGEVGGRDLAIDALYEAGLEFSSLEGLTMTSVPLRFHCPDPVYCETTENAAVIGTSTTSTVAAMLYRPSAGRGTTPGRFEPIANTTCAGVLCGEWATPPYGAASMDALLYLGGSFTACGSLSPKGVLTFSPSTLAIAAAAFGPYAGTKVVYALKQTQSYLWAGGNWSGFHGNTTNHSTYAYLARQNLAVPGSDSCDYPVTMDGIIYALAYDTVNDVLYAGGAQSSPQALLSAIIGASGASPSTAVTQWGALTVVDAAIDSVRDLTIGPDGSLYVVAAKSATSTGFILRGTPSATSWAVIGTFTWTNALVGSRLVWGADGALYYVGDFAAISPGPNSYGLAKWNGYSWVPFGGRAGSPSGTNAKAIAFDLAGRAHITGKIVNVAGDMIPGNVNATSAAYVVSEGSRLHVELLYATPTGADEDHFPRIFVNPWDGSILYVGNDNANPTLITYAVPAAVTYTGTAPAPITLVYQQNATTPGYIGGLRNERTGQAVYFKNLNLFAGETLYLDSNPQAPRVFSDMRRDLSQYVVVGSDIANFVLLPGVNYLSALMAGSASAFQSDSFQNDSFQVGNAGNPQMAEVYWANRHDSIDGAASSLILDSYVVV
jgi:hypothetical protein